MSRFGNDGDGDYEPLDMGRWENNLRRAITGKRGQKVLRELREALLALPERRLVAGDLATPEGEVCTVGAYVAWKKAQDEGVAVTDAAKALAAVDPEEWDGYERNPETGAYQQRVSAEWLRDGYWTRTHGEDEGAGHTTDCAVASGMCFTLAYDLGWRNDEFLGDFTPEGRWQAVFNWVESKIVEPAEVQP